MALSLKRLYRDEPHLDGFIHPDFRAVEATLRSLLKNYPGGAAVCVYHRGVCVADLWGGVRDRDGAPWQRDTMAPSFSTVQAVGCTPLCLTIVLRSSPSTNSMAR